jgi:polyhydroxyalkanoate synthase
MITTSSSEAEAAMNISPRAGDSALAPKLAAPQHRPRPLPAFLELLRSETAGDPARLARALAGLRRYQEAERSPPPPPAPAVAERLGASLRAYGGSGTPILFVPSLINPPSILDLGPRSLLRWLADQGHRPMLVDWGWPDSTRMGADVAGHVEAILLPLIAALDEPPILAGYCLGGTMALAAAGPARARAVALIAAPWHFAGFPQASRSSLLALWDKARPAAEALGLLPMEILQTAFWSLDPARTVGKFEAFAAMPEASAEARSFVALEDWANDGPPLTRAAARELFEDFFRDDLPGSGRWRVGGAKVDLAALNCPVLDIVSTTDRIVPAATAASVGERLQLGQGHVGMIVGGKAREALWRPLSDWLSRVKRGC